MEPSQVQQISPGLDNLVSYGALGVVTLYFIVKDFTVTKELRNALQDFRDVLLEMKGRVAK